VAHGFALSGSNLISLDAATPTDGTMIAVADLGAGETTTGTKGSGDGQLRLRGA
jgi:hypothetical protein